MSEPSCHGASRTPGASTGKEGGSRQTEKACVPARSAMAMVPIACCLHRLFRYIPRVKVCALYMCIRIRLHLPSAAALHTYVCTSVHLQLRTMLSLRTVHRFRCVLFISVHCLFISAVSSIEIASRASDCVPESSELFFVVFSIMSQ